MSPLLWFCLLCTASAHGYAITSYNDFFKKQTFCGPQLGNFIQDACSEVHEPEPNDNAYLSTANMGISYECCHQECSMKDIVVNYCKTIREPYQSYLDNIQNDTNSIKAEASVEEVRTSSAAPPPSISNTVSKKFFRGRNSCQRKKLRNRFNKNTRKIRWATHTSSHPSSSHSKKGGRKGRPVKAHKCACCRRKQISKSKPSKAAVVGYNKAKNNTHHILFLSTPY